MLRVLTLLLAISALVLALRALETQSDIGTPAQPRLTTPDNSDYYMTDAVVHQMDPHGDLAYRMTLGQTLHFADDSARLSDIHVHYLAGTTTYWNVDAARGRVPAGRRDIYLYDGVTAHHPRPDGPVMTVTTEHAWVRPDADRIDTQAHVKAVEPGRRVEGDGMEVDLEADTLKLRNDVHVTYTP